MEEYRPAALPAPAPMAAPVGLHGQPEPVYPSGMMGPPPMPPTHEVQRIAPEVEPQGPMRRGPARPARPQLTMEGVPEELLPKHGGFFYGDDEDDYRSKLDLARMSGGISQAQHDDLLAKYDRFSGSIPGMQQERQRRGMEYAEGLAADRQDAAREDYQWGRTQDAYMQAAEDQRRKAEGEREQQRKDFSERYQQQIADYEREAKDIADTKVSGSLGVGQGLLAVFGSFLLGYTGQGQSALNQVQRMVQNNLAEQKAQLANRRAGLAAKDNVLNRMRNVFQDEDAANQATILMAWQGARRDLDRLGNLAIDRRKLARANELKGQMDFRIEDMKAGLKMSAEALAQERARALAATRAQPRKPGQQSGKPMKGMVYVEAARGFTSADDAKKLKAGLSANESLQANIRELASLEGSWVPGSDAKARAEVLINKSKLDLAKAGGQGAISEGDNALYDGMITAPWKPGGAARLKTLAATFQNQIDALRRNSNVVPGVERREVDKKGNVVTKHYYQPSE